jgi:hypothetical protein
MKNLNLTASTLMPRFSLRWIYADNNMEIIEK